MKLFQSQNEGVCTQSFVGSGALVLLLKADASSSFIYGEKLVQTTFKYHSVSLITHPVCVKVLVATGTEQCSHLKI